MENLPSFPSLTPDERIWRLHWEALDEDISVPGLLSGMGDATMARGLAA